MIQAIQDPVQTVQEQKTPAAKSEKDVKNLRLKQLQELASSFEAIFMNMLMKSMRSTVKKSGFFDGGRGEEVFTKLFDTQIAERGAQRGESGGLGIAKAILNRYEKYVKPSKTDPTKKAMEGRLEKPMIGFDRKV